MILALVAMWLTGQHFDLTLSVQQQGLILLGSIFGASAQLLQTAGVQSSKSATATAMV
jgi:hypothetical protein